MANHPPPTTADTAARPPFVLPRGQMLAISLAIVAVLSPLLAVQFGLTARAPILAGNEGAHVDLLYAIAHRHTFQILHENVDLSIYKGRLYSNKPPGYSFLLAGPYWIEEALTGGKVSAFHFAKAASGLFSLLTVLAVFLFLATYPLSRGSVAFGTAAAAVGTIFPAYSILANSTPLALLLCVTPLLFYRLYHVGHAARVPIAADTRAADAASAGPNASAFGVRRASRRPCRYGPDGGNAWHWAAAAFLAAYGVVAEYANAFFLVPLVLWMARDIWRRPRLVVFALPSLVPVGLLLFYNYQCFEQLFVLTYSYYRAPPYLPWGGVSGGTSLGNVPFGLYGLLVSPSHGMFLLSPVTLLGAIMAWQVLRKGDADLRLLVWVAIAGIFIRSLHRVWDGGHCVGYRYILQSAVLVAMLSAFFFHRVKGKLRHLAVAVLVFSCLSGIASFLIHLDPYLVGRTWKAELGNAHASYYTELVPGIFRGHHPTPVP